MTVQQGKVALVTGANRGLGFEVCRQLHGRGARVILAARDVAKGRRAAAALAPSGSVDTCELDVTNPAHIENAFAYVTRRYGRLDILVNNAAVLSAQDANITRLPWTVAQTVMATNCVGALAVTQALLPLLLQSPDARVINVSSGIAAINDLRPDRAAYRFSKVCLNASTIMLARELPSHVAVNAVCPGWMRTDMGGPDAPRSVEIGADTIVWLALDAPAETRGHLLRDRSVIPW